MTKTQLLGQVLQLCLACCPQDRMLYDFKRYMAGSCDSTLIAVQAPSCTLPEMVSAVATHIVSQCWQGKQGLRCRLLQKPFQLHGDDLRLGLGVCRMRVDLIVSIWREVLGARWVADIRNCPLHLLSALPLPATPCRCYSAAHTAVKEEALEGLRSSASKQIEHPCVRVALKEWNPVVSCQNC